jgi:hypothetical protein
MAAMFVMASNVIFQGSLAYICTRRPAEPLGEFMAGEEPLPASLRQSTRRMKDGYGAS